MNEGRASNTLVQALTSSAELTAGISYLEGDTQASFLSYADLLHRASRILGELQSRELRPGALVVLQMDGNAQLVDGFWACLLGGFVPVPLNVGTTDEQQLKTLNVMAQLDSPTLLTQDRNPERLWEYSRRLERYDEFTDVFHNAIDVTQIPQVGPLGIAHEAKPEDIATIQYSSGSTGAPKGVILTHNNLLSDIRAIIEAAALTRQDSHLSWVPLTHDLGMVMFHLLPLVLGVNQFLIPANRFARRPRVWLEAASNYRATVLCSPNFGYQHYLKSFDKMSDVDLDLSAVRMIFNGGEPITRSLCEDFERKLAAHGLSRGSVRPAYGLAEACVMVSMTEPGTPVTSLSLRRDALIVGEAVPFVDSSLDSAIDAVCVGFPVSACDLDIVDETDQPVTAGCYGKVMVRGPIVSHGYYGLEPGGGADRWLDTGDLGFVAAEQLYILGRAKDALVINGVNYHPNDLERLCKTHLDMDAGRVTCCGVPDPASGVEQLLIFVVHRQDMSEFRPIVSQVKRMIGEQTQLEVAHVLPVRKMPKTTSGKIQRYKLVAEYLAGDFHEVIENLRPVAEEGELEGLERELHGVFNSVLPDVALGRKDNFVDSGVSSLALAEIGEAIDLMYPDVLELSDYLEYQTIAELAIFLEQKLTDT